MSRISLQPERNKLWAEKGLRTYYVYILTNKDNNVLYTGVTGDLSCRVSQHRLGKGSKFTARYHATKLVYYEIYHDVFDAITREKQIKGGSRQKKINLVNEVNPDWEDLFIDL
jgi:putative endonuclease